MKDGNVDGECVVEMEILDKVGLDAGGVVITEEYLAGLTVREEARTVVPRRDGGDGQQSQESEYQQTAFHRLSSKAWVLR